jgi:hypothetical protein
VVESLDERREAKINPTQRLNLRSGAFSGEKRRELHGVRQKKNPEKTNQKNDGGRLSKKAQKVVG